MNSDPRQSRENSSRAGQLLGLVFLVALLGRLPALQTWWCLDDWGQLARAAGTLPHPNSFPARILSQHWWWSLTWPWLGLNAPAHAFLRLILHALAAVAVTRLALRAGLRSGGALVTGLVFSASPLVFTLVFWASGIQELLAVVLALWAVERWLAAGSWAPWWALVLAGLSMLAKESGLGLPLLFMALALKPGSQRLVRWGIILCLLLLAGWESSLVLKHFTTGEADPYRLGGLSTIIRNLGQFGVWLSLPTPVFPPRVPWPQAGWGFALWGGWAGGATWFWIRGRRLPALALGSALLSLAVALPLVHQAKPYLAYGALAALALTWGTVADAVGFRWDRKPLLILLAGLAVVVPLVAMNARLHTSDPVVQATRLARDSARQIRLGVLSVQADPDTPVVVFQQPLRPETVRRADRLGPAAVRNSPRHAALLGEIGLKLVSPGRPAVRWVNTLTGISPTALVFCETGSGLEFWGRCRQALFYAAMVDVLAGSWSRAAAELLRADQVDADVESFSYDPLVVEIPLGDFISQCGRFHQWLQKYSSDGTYTMGQRRILQASLRGLVTRVGH